jgi:hypothetical protein
MADDVTRLMLEAGFQDIERASIDAGTTPALCVLGVKPAVQPPERGTDRAGW